MIEFKETIEKKIEYMTSLEKLGYLGKLLEQYTTEINTSMESYLIIENRVENNRKTELLQGLLESLRNWSDYTTETIEKRDVVSAMQKDVLQGRTDFVLRVNK